MSYARRGMGSTSFPSTHGFFDPSIQWLRVKHGYESLRGSVMSDKFSGQVYPRTTWADVVLVYKAWLNYTDESRCQAALPPGLYTGNECKPTKDAAYVRALSNFTFSTPRTKVSEGVLVSKIESGEEYPWNDEFWGYGQRFALELSSSVDMPTKWDYGVEAVSEAITELPGNIASAINRYRPKLPDFSWIAQLTKLSMYAGGAYILWWALKPKKKTA